MISTIIPTYKCPDALDLCLKSAINGQKNKNQIIVVVDGFYELNRYVLNKYSNHIEVLKLDQNIGLCRATNLGVYNAANEKILIVNDDNVFPKHWDKELEEIYDENHVIAPNQVEPFNSMFRQFIIRDFGGNPNTFDLGAYWAFADTISHPQLEESGSTLPIFMSKTKYLMLGGWDENYELGMVADWDFFLKCQLAGLKMVRYYNCHFYHFVSFSTSTPEKVNQRQQSEQEGHAYAIYKWGTHIKHNPINNLKYL